HAVFDREVQKLGGANKGPQVQWVEDPHTTQPTISTTDAAKSGDKQIYVWIAGDVLVASPKLDQLTRVANGASNFSATPFYSRIAGVYREGAGLMVAADLEKLIAHTRGLRRSGVGDQHEGGTKDLG